MTEIVILPGLDGTAALLETFCSAMSQLGYAARAISYPVDQPLGYDELEHLVRAQLPTANRYVLVGESFSGPLAIKIAATTPGNLAGLVLSTTFARTPVRWAANLTPLIQLAPARPPIALLSWLLLGRWSSPPLRSKLAFALNAVAPSVLRTRAAATLTVDASSCLPLIRVPALQLVADNDRLLTRTTSEQLTHGIESCRSVTISGPHLLLQTAAPECARIVAEFTHALGP